MDDDPTTGFRKLNFLLRNPPFPPPTFGNLLLLYCKFYHYDLAADVSVTFFFGLHGGQVGGCVWGAWGVYVRVRRRRLQRNKGVPVLTQAQLFFFFCLVAGIG